MASVISEPDVLEIGEIAGLVWHVLDDQGPQPLSKIVKRVGAQRDVVMQAVGWLAREKKIAIESDGRTRIISLR